MQTVKISGWEPGLKKISLTKLLENSARKDLAEAKAIVDGLLEGRSFEISFEDNSAASAFVHEATLLGAKIEIPGLR
jgi:hypothetical protein